MIKVLEGIYLPAPEEVERVRAEQARQKELARQQEEQQRRQEAEQWARAVIKSQAEQWEQQQQFGKLAAYRCPDPRHGAEVLNDWLQPAGWRVKLRDHSNCTYVEFFRLPYPE